MIGLRSLWPVVAFAVSIEGQAPPVHAMPLSDGDSIALALTIRERPADARQQLGDLLMQAGRAHGPAADSILRYIRTFAAMYATTWNDSFAVSNVARFERMTPTQRAAKVAADSLRRAGNAALGNRGVAAAIALWRRALRQAMAVHDTAGAAAAAGNIGTGFYRATEYDSASVYLARAQRLADAVGDRRTSLNASGVLGNIALERGQLRLAQETIARTLEQRMPLGDVRGAVADHTNLGRIAAELNDETEARAHYDASLGLARTHELRDGVATALLNLANLDAMQGELAMAVSRYEEALGIYRALDDDASAALVLHNLGLVALRRGDYRTARAHLHSARTIFARIGTLEDQVQVRRDLASVDIAAGDPQSALGHLRRAEQLLARSPEEVGLAAAVALARADLAVELNELTAADELYARAQMLFRRARDASGEAEAQHGRAMLLVERRQYASALEQLRLVARRQRSSGDRRPAALTQLAVGHVLHRQGRLALARRTYELALDSLRILDDAAGEASALGALGDLELESRAPLAAEASYRRGLERLRGRDVPTISWTLHAGLGHALEHRGAFTEAAEELRRAIADIERMATTLSLTERRSTFLADKWAPYAELALLERRNGDIAAAFAASEQLRSRQMRELLARGRVAPSRTGDRIAREQDLRTKIDELTRRLEEESREVSTMRGPGVPSPSSGVAREALAAAQRQYSQLLLDMRDDAGIAPVVRGDVADWRAIAARLATDQALLAYLVTDSTTMVLVVRTDTIAAVDLALDRRTLAALVDFARGTLTRRGGPDVSPAWGPPLRRLYRHLVAPAADAGLLAGARRLVVIPHAELHYLPFAALMPDDVRREFLVERYDISYAPSATIWLHLANRPATANARVLALAPRSKSLPGSREEVEAIGAIHGAEATVLVDTAATERALRSTAHRYGIVHLATYGVLNQHNPLFSHVDLAGRAGGDDDGRLEVHEVFDLSLDARLLVLSACQTALASGAVSDVPAGDDWVGLVRAFLGVGARNVLATLWAVEDRSTARLMEQTHRRLRAGNSEMKALGDAQREMLRNPGTSDPFHWAGFVLVGGQ